MARWRPRAGEPAQRGEPPSMAAGCPPGFWQREASHHPQPLSPMFRSIWLPAVNAALKHALDEYALPVETVELREIRGWVYMRRVPLGGKDRAPLPAWALRLLIRLVPRLRDRVRRCEWVVRSSLQVQYVERWYQEWRGALCSRLTDLQRVQLASLDDGALDGHIAALQGLVFEAFCQHFLLHGAQCLTLANLVFTCRALLGWDDQEALGLVSGLSSTSTAPAHRLAVLAGMAHERPARAALLERIDGADGDVVHSLPAADADFGTALSSYLDEFGARTLRYEVADPTINEYPALIAGLLRDQIRQNYRAETSATALEQRRTVRVAAARAALAGHPAADRERFERALRHAERAYPVREENAFYAMSVPLALLRYAPLAVGCRLAARGAITHRDDVFLLELPEAREALRNGLPGTSAQTAALISVRRAERAWAEAHPGPGAFGRDPGLLGPLDALPPAARFATEAFLWYADRWLAPVASAQQHAAHASLKGVAAAPGRYTGPARVIHSEAEFDKLRPGDVLVSPTTSPVWSVLFPSIGALLADSGGILSHSAIIAREHGVPAVVALRDGTRRLRDGQVVTVDGDTGTVTVRL